MRTFVKSMTLVIGLILGSKAVLAHHGASVVYDLAQSMTMTGAVTDFQFVNPHVLIYFEVEADEDYIKGSTCSLCKLPASEIRILGGLSSMCFDMQSGGGNLGWTKHRTRHRPLQVYLDLHRQIQSLPYLLACFLLKGPDCYE